MDNKYIKYIIFLIIVFPLKNLIKKIDKNLASTDNLDASQIIKKYLVNGNNANDISVGIKPKLWIYLPYEKNSRKWESFNDRSSLHFNQPYTNLTMKSVIDKCQHDFDIAIIDDNSFEHLLPDHKTHCKNFAKPLKDNLRKLYVMEILYKYGGFLVPYSFLCFKNLIEIYNKCTADHGCFIVENISNNSYGKSFSPDSSFMGAIKENKTIEEFIEFIKKYNYDLTNNSKFTNNLDRWCHKQVTNNKMSMLEATMIGTKKSDGRPLILEDIVGTTIPNFKQETLGIYIPSEELKTRHKFAWFTYLSEQELLTSNTVFTKYLLNSY